MLRSSNIVNIRELSFPWKFQLVIALLFVVLYPSIATFIYLVIPGDAGGIIAGSVFGGYPIFLEIIFNRIKKPYLNIKQKTKEVRDSSGIVCRYPHRLYIHEEELNDSLDVISSVNSTRIIITVENIGWGGARNCRVWVSLREANNTSEQGTQQYQFPARWEKEDNPLEIDLNSGQAEEVVLAEVDLNTNAFRTALSHKLPSATKSKQNEYDTVKRFEISKAKEYKIRTIISCEGMPDYSFCLDVGGEKIIRPEELPSLDGEWDVLNALETDSTREFAAWYREEGQDIIRSTSGFDLSMLTKANLENEPETREPLLPDDCEELEYSEVLSKDGFENEKI